jgi:hypothetical protein
MVDEDAQHDLRRRRQHVLAQAPLDAAVLGQAQVGLAHQRARLQRMPAPLLPHAALGDAVELLVENRHQSVERGAHLASAIPLLGRVADGGGFHDASLPGDSHRASRAIRASTAARAR